MSRYGAPTILPVLVNLVEASRGGLSHASDQEGNQLNGSNTTLATSPRARVRAKAFADAPRFAHTAVQIQLPRRKRHNASTMQHKFKILDCYEVDCAEAVAMTGHNVTTSRRAGSEAKQGYR